MDPTPRPDLGQETPSAQANKATFQLQAMFGARWGMTRAAHIVDVREQQAAASRHLAGEASRYSDHTSPKDPDALLDAYRLQNGTAKLTPRQARRWRHKARKAGELV